ncbi:aldose 1-epimerase family protein [Autumnicola psychrophila]|uniref:Aldose 1-epimerase family protein n=1 Tax=Autumnicola psychrophila TaxID=3075592 RepID=A0ABU3DSF2_9FLAO|nr:aldose 1-epimerase family protein [Zunongwangia sp. F225]MDT0686648.1 aldose 1-epimerase family protein [Zunongwangia sp. F225]
MKKFTIQNEHLSISVLEKGAELCSIKNLKTEKEHIWQANPEIWSSHAPNLFPIIGILKGGQYFYKGKTYEMPKHGMLRHNEDIRVKEKAENKLVFELIYSEESLKTYPFKFNFQIIFKLKGKKLKVSHKITNLDSKIMFFSLGGHPAFNTPINNDEKYKDYYLEFDQNMDLSTHILNNEGLVSLNTKKILQNEKKIQLHEHLFDDDALIFKNIPSKEVALKSQLSGTILTLEYSDFKNLGVWAKPGAPYVCIEPWLGIADLEGTDQNLETKEDILKLEAGKKFEAAYTIKIE